MIKVEVKHQVTEHVTGTSNRTGKPYSFHRQVAYAHLVGEEYPVKFELTHDSPGAAYQPGFYTLDPSSIFVDRFGGLGLGRIRLRAIAQPATSAAAK
jgi:hypothetical protein